MGKVDREPQRPWSKENSKLCSYRKLGIINIVLVPFRSNMAKPDRNRNAKIDRNRNSGRVLDHTQDHNPEVQGPENTFFVNFCYRQGLYKSNNMLTYSLQSFQCGCPREGQVNTEESGERKSTQGDPGRTMSI